LYVWSLVKYPETWQRDTPLGLTIPLRSLTRRVPVFVNLQPEQLMGFKAVSCKVGIRSTR
jgi:hypothetical protein